MITNNSGKVIKNGELRIARGFNMSLLLVLCLLSCDNKATLGNHYHTPFSYSSDHTYYSDSKYGPYSYSTRSTPRAETQMISVQMIFRHGKRTQLETFPTDKFSPDVYKGYGVKGFGQLVESGAVNSFKLGKFLRHRYRSFGLAPKYSIGEITAVSSDLDRTIMTGLAVFQGMYPKFLNPEHTGNYSNVQTQTYDHVWFPVPVRRIAAADDNFINYSADCKNYKTLFIRYMNSSKINTPQVNKLYKYLTKHSGKEIKNFKDVHRLWDAIFDIQNRDNGLAVPQWALKVKEEMFPLYLRWFYGFVDSPDMMRFGVGPMLYRLQANFECVMNMGIKGCNLQKKYAVSAHDTTISPLLILFDKYDKTSPPPYNAVLLFELHKKGTDYYVEIYYRSNSSGCNSGMQELLLDACEGKTCLYRQFKKAYKEYTLSDDQWHGLCELHCIKSEKVGAKVVLNN